jgi:hypothetical protein
MSNRPLLLCLRCNYHPSRLFDSVCLWLLMLLMAPVTNAETTVAVDPVTQKHIETIQTYYQTVQDQLPNRAPNTPHKQPVIPSTPPQSPDATKTIKEPVQPIESAESKTLIEPTFIPSIFEQNNPVSSGANINAAAYTPAGRDPFAVTPVMLENENYTLRQSIEFTPLDGNFKVPNMRLKGIINDKENNQIAALLEIDGLGVFVVREGDTVGLHSIGNGRDVIQIESISRLSLIVQAGSYGGTTQKRFVVR